MLTAITMLLRQQVGAGRALSLLGDLVMCYKLTKPDQHAVKQYVTQGSFSAFYYGSKAWETLLW
jgi:hypothetical protein